MAAGLTTCSWPIRSGRSGRRRPGCGRSTTRAAWPVGLDSVAGAERLAAAVAGVGRPLHVPSRSIPVPAHRTCALAERAVDVARAATDLGLVVVGVFSHGGHSYAAPKRAGRRGDEVRDAHGARPTPCRDRPRRADRQRRLDPDDDRRGDRPGDRDPRRDVPPRRPPAGGLGSIAADSIALHVAATVVSTAVSGQVVIDAGAKTLTKDRAAYLAGHGLLPAYPDASSSACPTTTGSCASRPAAPAPHLGEVVADRPEPRLSGRRPVRGLRRRPRRPGRWAVAGRRAGPERLTARAGHPEDR